MNFMPATAEGDKVKLPFGEVPVPAELKAGASAAGEVIVGIRPESFEDAAVVTSPRGGTKFRARIDLVESMGSEKYAYFGIESGGVESEELAELAEDSGAGEVPGGGRDTIVARLDAASQVERGVEAELWVDASKLHLFDPKTGQSLRAPRS
jgi:multiple sugar transport system ATP-binding protein